MSALDQIELLAHRVEREYLGYQTSLKALLGEFLDRPDAYSGRARSELADALRRARIESLGELTGILHVGLDQVAGGARDDVGMEMSKSVQEDWSMLTTQSTATATAQISDAMRMDEDAILAAFRRVQLASSMRSAQGIDHKVAFNMVKGGVIVGLSFTRRGRGGAAWMTSVYARTVARALMVMTYTEVFLMTLLSNGIEIASIPADDRTPILFSITGSAPGMPTLDDITGRYLHPNASRLVSKAPVT